MKKVVTTVKKLLSNEFGFKVSNRQIYLPSITSDLARYADFCAQKLGLYITDGGTMGIRLPCGNYF